jgi:hypothetical protein
MKNIDFTIDIEDLKCLFIVCTKAFKNVPFDSFVNNCKISYCLYHKRNTENLEKYGSPKTFSQWVNGQIIALT